MLHQPLLSEPANAKMKLSLLMATFQRSLLTELLYNSQPLMSLNILAGSLFSLYAAHDHRDLQFPLQNDRVH